MLRNGLKCLDGDYFLMNGDGAASDCEDLVPRMLW